jgi:hypothetical protein
MESQDMESQETDVTMNDDPPTSQTLVKEEIQLMEQETQIDEAPQDGTEDEVRHVNSIEILNFDAYLLDWRDRMASFTATDGNREWGTNY